MDELLKITKDSLIDKSIVTIIAFWGALFILSIYFAINVLYFDYQGGVFWSLLGISFFIMLIIFVFHFSKTSKNRIFINYSSLFFTLLVLYISIRIIIDKGDVYYLKSYTCGFLLYYILGSLFSFSLNKIAYYCYQSNCIEKINYYFYNIYILLNLFLFSYVFICLFPRCQPDYFLIDTMGFYQRPGDLMIINTFFISICYMLFFYHKRLKLHSIAIISLYTFVSCILIQFIGSNKAFGAIAGIFFINLLYHLYLSNKKNKTTRLVIFKSLYIKKLFDSLSISFIRKTILVLLAVSVLLVIFHHNFPRMRIFNFNEDINPNSLEIRLGYVKDFFPTQYSISPIIGNMNVDAFTFGQGTYPHSFILSMLTHCGLLGTLLFFIYFLLALIEFYNEIKQQSKSIAIYHKFYLLYLTIFMFFMANISSFLVWYPIWFVFGFCFPIIIIKNNSFTLKIDFRKASNE